ncbi:MAG TPA: FecR family protein [Nitrospiria bacterium]
MCIIAQMGVLLTAPSVFAQTSIGSVLIEEGAVLVLHSGQKAVLTPAEGDDIFVGDIYETQDRSRVRLLFEDDSLVTVGEKSRLEILEHSFDPSKNRRIAVMKVASGRVRLQAGKGFSAAGARFEVQTPTALASVSGTTLISWVFTRNGKTATGLLSLEGGVEVGNIDVKVGGKIQLSANRYAIVEEGQAPSAAATADSAMLNELLASTVIQEEPMELIESGPAEPPGVAPRIRSKVRLDDSGFIVPGPAEPTPSPSVPPSDYPPPQESPGSE